MLNSEPPEGAFSVTPVVTHPGQSVAKSPFLASMGFGWLVETDEAHESMFDRPLVEELDIDLAEIWYKIRCVLLPLPQVSHHLSS